MDTGDIEKADLIDVWNSSTFGGNLLNILQKKEDLIVRFHAENTRLASLDKDRHLVEVFGGNRYFREFDELKCVVAAAMSGRTVRVWHYARLFDFEVEGMWQGIELSNGQHMRGRLNELERRGHLSRNEIEKFVAGSVLQTQSNYRENQFWCVSAPIDVTNVGVVPLLGNWGGEAVYKSQQDGQLSQRLKIMGVPRVIEISIKLIDSQTLRHLSDCVLTTFSLEVGSSLCPEYPDLCLKEDLSTAKVIAVHTEGETSFREVGTVYPAGVDMLIWSKQKWDERSVC